jgi:phage FluMu gp28-like protein
VTCHHVDSFDAAAAGLKTFSLKTREEITPQQHRAEALDRDAWDRNYGLIHKAGGTAAVSLAVIHSAMVRGRDQCVFAEDEFPLGWRDLLGNGKFSLGYDVATTEGGQSNPSSITVMEQLGNDFFARLKIIWKTADPAVARAMVREALELGGNRRVRRLCIDASNERYFAVDIKREFGGHTVVELIVSGESTTYGGVAMNYKSYLGNLLVNTIDDGHLILPEARYVKDDYRLVKRDRGGFSTDTDSQGRHGDTFDSDKLALHGLLKRGGRAQAEAVSLSNFARRTSGGTWKINVPDDTGVKNHA